MALQHSIRKMAVLCRHNLMHPTSYRLLSVTAVTQNQMDPVQQIFADQVANYKKLSAQQGGGAVDAGPEYQQRKEDAINRLKKVYNVDDATKFPEFKFAEPDLNQDDI